LQIPINTRIYFCRAM